jgi:hypothetical protein
LAIALHSEARLRLEAEWEESLAAGRSMAEAFGLATPMVIGEWGARDPLTAAFSNRTGE